MARHRYDPKCPDCRPVLVDPYTGKRVPRTDPLVVLVDRLWEEASVEVREAFVNVTVYNSRAERDLSLANAFLQRVEEAGRS